MRVGQISVAGAGAAVSVVVHHFNVPALLDVLDRFIALHYTDWESLNGRNINNPPAQPRLASRYCESNAQNQSD